MTEGTSQRQYAFSGQPEMMRLNQQDDSYQSLLKSKIIDGLEIFMPWLFNYRLISRNEDIIRMIGGLIYYYLTTMRSTQTLGEEYTSLAQFNPNTIGLNYKNHPLLSKSRRAMFVFLATVFPVISSRLIKKGYNYFKQKLYSELNNNSFAKILLKNLPDYDSFVQVIFKFHLAVFFVDGVYLQIAKRITSIKYIYTKKPQEHGLNFQHIGRLMLIQMAIETIKYFYKSYVAYTSRKKRKTERGLSLENVGETKLEQSQTGDDAKICPLCYDVRKNTACTPCGHLFCWDCIMKNCLIKEECPQCRKNVKPNKIIQLRNYG